MTSLHHTPGRKFRIPTVQRPIRFIGERLKRTPLGSAIQIRRDWNRSVSDPEDPSLAENAYALKRMSEKRKKKYLDNLRWRRHVANMRARGQDISLSDYRE